MITQRNLLQKHFPEGAHWHRPRLWPRGQRVYGAAAEPRQLLLQPGQHVPMLSCMRGRNSEYAWTCQLSNSCGLPLASCFWKATCACHLQTEVMPHAAACAGCPLVCTCPAFTAMSLTLTCACLHRTACTAAICHRLLFPSAGQRTARSQQLQGGPDISRLASHVQQEWDHERNAISAGSRSRLAATGRSGGHRDSASPISRTDGQQGSKVTQLARAALTAREATQLAHAMVWPTTIRQLSLTWTQAARGQQSPSEQAALGRCPGDVGCASTDGRLKSTAGLPQSGEAGAQSVH